MTRSSKNEADTSAAAPFVCDTMYEVPALRDVHVEQIAAGGRTSYARRAGGGVLAWGANEFGQLAQGANCLATFMSQPTEIPLAQTYPSGSIVKCTNIAAGGDIVFMTVTQVENSSPRPPLVDILAAGMGRSGALGNALFTHAQSSPVRVKTISGVLEYDETTRQLEPLRPDTISVSPNSHVFVTLSPRHHHSQESGHDLLAFGANTEYQLGNGKRGSVAVPTYLPGQHGEERWMLHEQQSVEVPNPGSWLPWSKTKSVQAEQRAVAGWNCGVVYWKIISP
jgi:alpha-tubulin suppressor-like RCC1 family protein